MAKTMLTLGAPVLLLASVIAGFAPKSFAQSRGRTNQLGSAFDDRAGALAPDSEGGTFVAGRTDGDLGGPNAGASDVFLARYERWGDLLWIRQFGTSEADEALALAPDGQGGVIVAGWTLGSLGGPNVGDRDVFLARYDSIGDRLWIRQFGSSEQDSAWALALDGEGGVFVGGLTIGDLGAHGER